MISRGRTVKAAAMTAVLVAILTAAGLFQARQAAAEVVQNTRVPTTIGVFVPCANGGAGEFVVLSGDLHVLSTVTNDGAGGFHVGGHFQPMGITGTGLITGDKYQATGVTRYDFNVKPPFPSENTYVNNYRMIGQGPGNNFLVHATAHVTVNANGDVTATVNNYSTTCK